jgi:PBP superfamily domain
VALRSRVLAVVAAALPLVLAAGYSGSTSLGEASAAQTGPGGGIPAGPAPGPEALSETGSTLLYPVLRNWAAAYRLQHPNVSIATAATGSGKGIAEASAGQAGIGASDAYPSSGDLVTNRAMVNIPLAVSAQQVNYNFPGLRPATHLKLNGKILALMYQGAITSWSGPRIAAINPGVALPHTRVHLTLLPAARASYAQENAALTAASAQATGLPWIVAMLILAIVLAFVLYRAQRWLSRSTHRVLNIGMLAATVALVVSAVWLIGSFAVARTDLQRAAGHGSEPAEALAQAAIDTQQARGYQVLNLISRSGDATFVKDFQTVRAKLGPGPGTLLAAAASSSSGAGAHWAAAAGRDLQSWYTAIGQAYALDSKAQYTTETALVIGTGANASTAGFARVEADLSNAINADDAVFHSNATAGRNAFTGLDLVIVIAAALMAAGCAWGLSRRLAEYR